MNSKVKIVLPTDAPLERETRFKCLNTLGFVRGVTEMDQWFLLVNEGWAKTNLPMNEVVRDYLVTMLQRYTKTIDLTERMSAFHFAEFIFGQRKIDSDCINDVADMCLQTAAFFPESSLRRHETRTYSYTVNMGTSLYQHLAREAQGKDDWFSVAYRLMSESFGQALLVLRSTCPRFLNEKMAFDPFNQAERFPTDLAAHKSSNLEDYTKTTLK